MVDTEFLIDGYAIVSTHLYDEDIGYALGSVWNGHTILKTTDGSNTWNANLLRDYSNTFTDFYFVDNNIGYTVGWGGVILKTTSAGDEWVVQNSGTVRDLFTIVFLDSLNGFAAGQTV